MNNKNCYILEGMHHEYKKRRWLFSSPSGELPRAPGKSIVVSHIFGIANFGLIGENDI